VRDQKFSNRIEDKFRRLHQRPEFLQNEPNYYFGSRIIFKPATILEIGTSLGLATSALALGNTKAKVITLEGCPQTANVAINQLA
jgi:tRNA A58 N-methylase Trm61